MAIADNRYSRFVQLAKIVFPIVALGLLSTLFLFSRNLDPSQAIPFADVDVEEIAREQRLASPKFSGMTSDGSEVSLVAQSASPDPENPRRLSADLVDATIKTRQGLVIEIDANRALFDGSSDLLDLRGDVRVRTSTGYSLATERLKTNIENTDVTSPGPVEGEGPDGTISADSMSLTTRGDGQVLVFKGDVKLVYTPQK